MGVEGTINLVRASDSLEGSRKRGRKFRPASFRAGRDWQDAAEREGESLLLRATTAGRDFWARLERRERTRRLSAGFLSFCCRIDQAGTATPNMLATSLINSSGTIFTSHLVP
jgi:hypothetical protein